MRSMQLAASLEFRMMTYSRHLAHRLGQLGPKKENDNPRNMGVNSGNLKLSHIGVASYLIFLNLGGQCIDSYGWWIELKRYGADDTGG